MDIFTGLALLMAAAFIGASFFHNKIPNVRRHRAALNLFLAFLVLYFGLPAIPQLGPLVAMVTRPLGVAALFISLRVMCFVPANTLSSPYDPAA